MRLNWRRETRQVKWRFPANELGSLCTGVLRAAGRLVAETGRVEGKKVEKKRRVPR